MAYIEEDPLLDKRPKKFRSLNELCQTMHAVQSKAHLIKTSVLIFMGDDDRAVSC